MVGEPAAPAAPSLGAVVEARETLVIAFSRDEKAAFSSALAATLGPDTPRLDTPARLAQAIDGAIRRASGAGRPIVTRSPAGLYTPEYWRIRVDGADGRARAELERLAGRRLES